MAKRLLLTAAVVAALIAIVVGAAVRLRFTPESRGDAHAAETDSVWSEAPRGMSEYYRHTGLADARWLPDQLRQVRQTIVQRAYRFDGPLTDALLAWDRAATSAGWRFVRTSCANLDKSSVVYTKELRSGPAALTVQEELGAGELEVVIALPSDPGAADGHPFSVPDCRYDDFVTETTEPPAPGP